MKTCGLVVGLACMGLSCASSTSGPADDEPVSFTDVTEEAGLSAFRNFNGAAGDKWYPEQMGSGGGFIDYNGNGWPDVILMGGGSWDPDTSTHPRGIWLYRNNGDGTFTDVTDEAGILDEWLWSASAIFFDSNRNGHLDLYVAGYADWTPETDVFCPIGGTVKVYCHPAVYTGVESRFYRNNGDGTFTEMTEEAGFTPTLGTALGVTELDFNNDGWPDLAVAVDGEGDLLYRNNGDGTFTEIGVRAGVAFSEHGEARAGMGIDAGVVDGTGHVSIFVSNFSEETVGVYRHVGGDMFEDRAAISRIGFPTYLTLGFGLFLFDVDLNGHLDFFLANGHVHPDRTGEDDRITYRQRAQLFLNRGDGTFEEYVAANGPLTEYMVARGAAYADFDRDGDLDVLITENDGPVHLWRNDTPGGNFLRVKVQGTESNRDGLGTRLVAVLGDHRMERRIRTGSSYLSQSEKAATFGLGAAMQVDSLYVYWPSGIEERFVDVEGNREVLLVEGSGTLLRQVLQGREPAM